MRKKIILIICGLLISSCAQMDIDKDESLKKEHIKKYENHALGVNMIITNDALDSYKSKYTNATCHKAFAQSLSGAWSWKADRTTVDHAKKSALVGCQRNNLESESLYPCKIINIDGEWVK